MTEGLGRRHGRTRVPRQLARILGLVLGLAVALVAAGCDATTSSRASDAPSANPNAGAIRVAAASSLAIAFTALKGPFEAANPGSHLVLTFGPAQAQVDQVQIGGFDVFAADDLALTQTVVANRHAAGPAQVFAGDRIVLVVPAANPGRISGPHDLARPGVRIAGVVSGAPLAAYTGLVISALAAQAGYGAEFTAAIATNTASRDDDAKGALARVENGQADAAFVYASDATASAKVSVVPLPDQAKISARFAVVIIATAVDPIAAAALTRWLTTKDGRQALAQYGFDPPGTT